MCAWQVQEAKARFSEVIDRAGKEGPQTITRHGKAQAVVISIAQYENLVQNRPSFKTHLLGGPKVRTFLVERSRDKGRNISL